MRLNLEKYIFGVDVNKSFVILLRQTTTNRPKKDVQKFWGETKSFWVSLQFWRVF